MEELEESQRVVPFQLQFDKPVASQIKIAEWNPEKDLLAMVTDDSKILLHRFNWQRLWTISPGKCVTSLCWRPDGKALAVGLENGTISLHDVENGKLLKTSKFHAAPVTCLNWEEDGSNTRDDPNNFLPYEDRTSRFFPPAPRPPRMPGVVSGDSGFMDENDDSYRELSNSSYQRFNILCSGDKDGVVCFTIFGIFPIGKINIHELSGPSQLKDEEAYCQVQSPSIHMIALSKDLCRLIVMCSGELGKAILGGNDLIHYGMHCVVLDTSIFCKRKKELHQLAQQASNIEELIEVIRTSLSVMCKQWCDAMQTFHGKFDSVSSLIADHALDSSPQEEFLSLLCGARISPAVHQFLVNSLGEAGMKRVSKLVSSAGKELQRIVLDHLQPAAEIIGFRMGELRGLSRWRTRYKDVGLDEMLLNNATEKSGMMLVQVERFMRVLTSVEHQFSNFFTWLLRCIKQLMQEPSDQLPPHNSELVVMFLKFLYDQDPVRQLLEPSQADQKVEVDSEMMQRVKELVTFGGFSDCDYLRRTLFKEFQQMSDSFKEAFLMPFTTISKKLLCVNLHPLFPLSSSPASISTTIPMSLSYYKEDALEDDPSCRNSEDRSLDYICFEVPGQHISQTANCIGILKGVVHGLSSSEKDSFEAALLSIPADYECVDLSLYKDSQLILLLNEATAAPESFGCMMSVQATELQFELLPRSSFAELWALDQLKESVTLLPVDTEKARRIPHSVVSPLAVSASRGIACVFAARKRALVYILDEDEEEFLEVEE